MSYVAWDAREKASRRACILGPANAFAAFLMVVGWSSTFLGAPIPGFFRQTSLAFPGLALPSTRGTYRKLNERAVQFATFSFSQLSEVQIYRMTQNNCHFILAMSHHYVIET